MEIGNWLTLSEQVAVVLTIVFGVLFGLAYGWLIVTSMEDY